MSAALENTWKHKIKESVEIPLLTRCCFCVPLRIGLIGFAYFNFVLTVVTIGTLSSYIKYVNDNRPTFAPDGPEYTHLCVDVGALVIESLMTIVFIFSLHKKHVPTMKVYMWFEIVFSAVGFVYSVALLSRETVNELFLLLFQLCIQVYLVVLIWSSIKKMERDGAVKYSRHQETPAAAVV